MKKISFSAMSAVAGLAGVLCVSSAMAARMYSSTYAYYSDASYSTSVGEQFIDCNGRKYYSGTVTPYMALVVEEPCRDGGYECPPENYGCF